MLTTVYLDFTKQLTMAGKRESLERNAIQDVSRVASAQQNNGDSMQRGLYHSGNIHAPNKTEACIMESENIKVRISSPFLSCCCSRDVYLYEHVMSTVNDHVNTTVVTLIALAVNQTKMCRKEPI